MNYKSLKEKLLKLNSKQLEHKLIVEDEYEDYLPAKFDMVKQFFVVTLDENNTFTYGDLLQMLQFLDDIQLNNKVKYMTWEENIYTDPELVFYKEEEQVLPNKTPYLTWR